MYGFVFNNPLSVVYLPLCERVRVVCVRRLFFARSSFVRFSCIRRPFSACPSSFLRWLWVVFALAFALNENGKGTF